MTSSDYDLPRVGSGALIPSTNLRAPAAAEYLGVSTSTLAKWRLYGCGPQYSKAGPRIVIYGIAELNAWLTARRRRSTSDKGEEGVR